MRAVRTEKLFQSIMGPGQIRHRRAGEESWPGTTGDLTEVPQRWRQCASRRRVSRQRAQESPEAALHRQRLVLVLVAEEVGCLMDPATPHPYVGPYRSRVPQAPCQQALQPTQCLGQAPPFFDPLETGSQRAEAVVEFEP